MKIQSENNLTALKGAGVSIPFVGDERGFIPPCPSPAPYRVVDPSGRWKRLSPPFRNGEVPNVAGCYVFYINGNIAYIGSSNGLWRRIRSYQFRRVGSSNTFKTYWGTGEVCLKYRTSDVYGDWLMIEARLIRRLKPPFNISGNPQPQRLIAAPVFNTNSGLFIQCRTTGESMIPGGGVDFKDLTYDAGVMDRNGCSYCNGGIHIVSRQAKKTTRKTKRKSRCRSVF